MNRITPGGSSPEFPRDQTIKITVEELCEIVKSGENFELGRSEADYEDIPADFVVASSPASSTSTESDHEGRDGYNGAAADEDDFLPRSSHSSRSHRSPIKTRASTRSKTG